ncbi:aldehyde dehydrogenase [Hypomontagnella monticulosa]|nr:aldehyde dehydrogenase [Hypomontagnella monticulosa]
MATNGNTTAPLDFTKFYNVIDGKTSSTPKTRFTINPSTLENNPDVPLSTLKDVDRAVEVAQKAQKAWAAVAWSERASAIQKFADAMEAQIEDLVKLIMMEQGKPVMWAQHEVITGVQWLRDFAKMSPPGDVIEDAPERKVTTRYTPLGVAVGIVPWNFSIQLSCMKIAPAILAGNAFIWKPSPNTPYCTLKLAELGAQFFPAGILQALSGDDGLGAMLTQHPGVDMISFTGSTRVGKKIMETCSKTLKHFTLEMGGNDAAIVCADVDPVAVAGKIAFIAFCNAGQICIAVKRVYVHEAVYDAVLATMVGFVQNLKLGLDAGLDFMGPISNKPQYERVKELLADIEQNKFTVAAGDTKPVADKAGYWLAPTVVDNPPDNSRIVVEEQFGPVLPLLKWSDEADVIQRANSSEAGLGASVWTRDTAQADRLSQQLQAGNIWINCHAEMQPSTPFTGHKQSGFGVEMGIEGLKAYCNVQSVYSRPA